MDRAEPITTIIAHYVLENRSNYLWELNVSFSNCTILPNSIQQKSSYDTDVAHKRNQKNTK